MEGRHQARPQRGPAPAGHAGRRWLLFVHQLPSTPSNLRVRTWRRLQQFGAIPIKQAVYILPDTPEAREDFEWLRTEIKASGGEASVFAAGGVDSWSDDELVEEFRRVRQDAYAALAREIERALRRTGTARRAGHGRLPSWRRAVEVLKERAAAIERVDFFGSAGRDRVLTLIKQLEEKAAAATPAERPPDIGDANLREFVNRTWVTRPRPGVDRMASAWLIQRFIDQNARFDFVVERDAAPAGSVPFDMFGVAFTHRGALCTFETLCDIFGLAEPAVARIGAIVHDLDLKDGRFAPPEAPAIGLVIEGLRLAQADDHKLLTEGITLFDALYRAFAQAARPGGPRPLAQRRRIDRNRRGKTK